MPYKTISTAIPRAEYGQQVVRNLSKDIGLSESLVWDILLFRRSLPILPTYGELGWSHIREVLPAPTQDQRLYYLRAAEEGAWSVRQLRQAIRTDAYGRYLVDVRYLGGKRILKWCGGGGPTSTGNYWTSGWLGGICGEVAGGPGAPVCL